MNVHDQLLMIPLILLAVIFPTAMAIKYHRLSKQVIYLSSRKYRVFYRNLHQGSELKAECPDVDREYTISEAVERQKIIDRRKELKIPEDDSVKGYTLGGFAE